MFTFREIETDDAKMILDWRTSERVAKYLKTEVTHGVEDQEQWIISCRDRVSFYHWLIMFQEKPIGYISINKYNPITQTASWGFYIGEEKYAGLGGLVPPFFYHFCFSELGIERIEAEMFFFNSKVINLHQLHGYDFTPEKDRVLRRDGKEILLISMSLEKHRFQASKFARFSAKFPTKKWKSLKSLPATNIKLVEVSSSDEQILSLYQLLKKRTHSISHEEMPSFEKHVDFVKNHPYRKWWLVESEGEKIGSVYLSVDNAVGINLLINDSDSICHIINRLKKDFEPLPLVPSVRPNFFFVNVAPDNDDLKQSLTDLGAKHVQNSFRI
jgi:RimJ/RimL family protein N-acetyltransferase